MPMLRRHRRHGIGSQAERLKWRAVFLGGVGVLICAASLTTHPHAISAGKAAQSYLPRSLLSKVGTEAAALPSARFLEADPEDCLALVDEAQLENVPPVADDFCGVPGDITCAVDEGFEGACCFVPDNETKFEDSEICLTLELETCAAEDLCVAELIPGSGVGAECLKEFEKTGGIPLYLFLLVYLFLALAIVCDDYFSYALDMLGDLMGMSSDVKGATFAAIGSSAPELFVSLADNVIANPPKSVGVGTIVGSAIFNILVIIGASAVVAGNQFGSIQLDWRPLSRDSFFYVISICALIAVAVTDDNAEHYEGAILVFLYLMYLTFMAFNQRIFNWVDAQLGIKKEEPKDEKEIVAVAEVDEDVKKLGEVEADAEGGDGEDKDFVRQATNKTGGSARMNLKRGATMDRKSSVHSAIGKGKLEDDEDVENEPYFSVLYWPAYDPFEEMEGTKPPVPFGTKYFGGGLKMWLRRLYFLLVFPINLSFRLTIPDSRYDLFGEDKVGGPKNHRPMLYWLEFLMCIVHIALASHFLVFSAARFGCLAGVDPAVMGLTVLAAGTSVPDMITSVILTRNGEGDAAVANSIGSNVFDILIGLGLPWFLAGFIHGGSAIQTGDIGIAIGFLFGVLIVLLVLLTFTKFRLNAGIGWLLLAMYALYVCFELFIRPNTIDKGEE